MKKVSLVVMAILVFSSSPAPAESIPNETAWAQGTNWEYISGFLGFPEAWVYVPDSYSRRVPGKRALVFHLLGCGQMPFQMAQGGGWPEAAEAFGMVVVIPGIVSVVKPNPYGPKVECYNYGYMEGSYMAYHPTRSDPDHAALIAAATDILNEYPDYQIDPNQVYLVGMSAGGAVATQVACMAPELFAGLGISATPGIGSSQATAVMPPNITASNIVNECTGYAGGSSHPDAEVLLTKQVIAIISDNNGLRPGQFPGDTMMFEDQSIWDGDKFCPHAYKPMVAEAMATIADLPSTPSESQVPVSSGVGIGCQGGEAARGDADEPSCMVKDAIDRNWTAFADIWRNPDGLVQLVRIEQDTLRHTWPSGPVGPGDVTVTPTRDDLDDWGYIDHSTGAFNKDKMKEAPNGIYGVIYANEKAMDWPMYLGQLFNDNNLRLDVTPDDRPPVIENLVLTPGGAPGSFSLSVEGTARDDDPDDQVARVTVLAENLTESLTHGPEEVPGNGTATLTFSVDFEELQAGTHRVTVTATDGRNRVQTATREIDIGQSDNLSPTVSLDSAAQSSAGCLSASGTASDPDGSVANVMVTIMGIGPKPANLSGSAWTFEKCDLQNGNYRLFVIASDDLGASSPPSPALEASLGGGTAEVATGTLTEHCDAGRVARWTEQYYEYRDKYCEQTGWTWECHPFDLYRCEGSDEWTDDPDACGGGEIPEVSLEVEISALQPEVSVNEEVQFRIVVSNNGPDGASAVWIEDRLPGELSYRANDSRCTNSGSLVVCHLDRIAASETSEVLISALTLGPGEISNRVEAYCAQMDGPASDSAAVVVGESQADGGTQTDGGSQSDGGSQTDGGTGSDAGTGSDHGSPRPDQDESENFYDFRDGDGTQGCKGCSTTGRAAGMLALLMLASTCLMRRRRF